MSTIDTLPPSGLKVVSFALWGNVPQLVEGARGNILLKPMYYPDWQFRLYCGDDVAEATCAELAEAGYVIHRRTAKHGMHDGLFWRFEPAFDPEVELFVSRDLDSRINPREVAAVKEWLASGLLLHTMRDHYQHIVPILGGMWGCWHWPAFKGYMADWIASGRIGNMGDDQDFLKEVVWPRARMNCIAHDRYNVDTQVPTENGMFHYQPKHFYGEHDVLPFPDHTPLIPACHGEHVGARVTH